MRQLLVLLLTLAVAIAAPIAPAAEACCGADAAASASPAPPSSCCCTGARTCCCVKHVPSDPAPASHDRAPAGPSHEQIASSLLAPATLAFATAAPPGPATAPAESPEARSFFASRPGLRAHLRLSIITV